MQPPSAEDCVGSGMISPVLTLPASGERPNWRGQMGL
jgi:hypothetical protein